MVSKFACGPNLVFCSSGIVDSLPESVDAGFAGCGVADIPFAAWAYEKVGISGLALIAAIVRRSRG